MKILLIDNGTSLLSKLQKLIPDSEITLNYQEVKNVNVNNFDLVILSGSKDSSVVWDHENYTDEINFIKECTIPLIGICFGSELINFAFGGTLKEMSSRHHGLRTINILNREIIGFPFVSVYENHRWIIEKLADQFIVLGESDDGPEIIRHIKNPIYGLQFHPENLADESYGDEIFFNIIKILSN